MQKADKSNNTVILNRSDYTSKLSKILEDNSKFKRLNLEEGKALDHLICKKWFSRIATND